MDPTMRLKKKKSSSIVNLLKNKKKGVKFFQIYKFILQIKVHLYSVNNPILHQTAKTHLHDFKYFILKIVIIIFKTPDAFQHIF